MYFESLLKIKESSYDEAVKIGLVTKLNGLLKILSEQLEEYLSKQDSNIKEDTVYFKSVKQLLFCENLEKLNFGNDDFNKSNTLILNFNYTNLTHQWAYEQENTTQINIHGELKSEENKIIFGYGDNTHHKYLELEQANDKEYLKNIKSMSYPLSNNYKKLLYFLNNGRIEGGDNIEHQLNFEVLIYGHSCGLSDRILLKTIFEHENCDVIHVAFYQDKNDYFDKTIEISRHFDKKDMFLEKLKPFNKKLIIPQLK